MTTDKKIEDYLHLYLGCEVKGIWGTGILQGFDLNGWCMVLWNKHFRPDEDFTTYRKQTEIKHVKPILRPLSDMSEEEHNNVAELLGYPKPYKQYKKEWFKWFWEGEGHQMFFAPAYVTEVFRYLLSIGIDLFDLIPAGLAIDATKINKNG